MMGRQDRDQGRLFYEFNRCRLPYRWDGASDGDNDVHFKVDEFCCDFCVALSAAL